MIKNPSKLFTSPVKINIDSLVFCYKTSSLTFLGRVGICEKEPWVTLSLLTTWCKMHEGHLAPCFRKGWHAKDTALCLLFLCINLGLNTFKCIPFLHFSCLLHNFFLMPAKHYYMQISCKVSRETKRLPKKDIWIYLSLHKYAQMVTSCLRKLKQDETS